MTTPETIIHLTASTFGITVEEILSKQRPDRIAIPRQIAMALVEEFCDLVPEKIGRAFDRSRVMVLHARGNMPKFLTDPRIVLKMNSLRNEIGGFRDGDGI